MARLPTQSELEELGIRELKRLYDEISARLDEYDLEENADLAEEMSLKLEALITGGSSTRPRKT